MQRMISLKKVSVHNLKGVDLQLQPNQLIVFTGVSGSGKSSLAFDTIYVEGQRRYIESLSTFARRAIGEMARPDAESIEGVSPTIAIEQKTAGKNPRSTVGTMTGVFDFLRVLYARIGKKHCPVSGEAVEPRSAEDILLEIEQLPEGSKVVILSPFAKGKKGEFKEEFAELLRKGFTRVRLDGTFIDLSEEVSIDGKLSHDVDLVIDRLVVRKGERGRLAEAITRGLEEGAGIVKVLHTDEGREELYSQHAYSPQSGLSYGPLEPQDFSFNHPAGMCPECLGLGQVLEFDIDKVIDPTLSIAEGACSIGSSYQTVRYGNIFDNLAELYHFSVHTPWKELSPEAKEVFLYGTKKKWVKMRFVHPQKGKSWIEYVQWRGVLHEAKARYGEATSDLYREKMEELMDKGVCPSCKGERLRAYPAATKLKGKTLPEVASLPISEAHQFFTDIPLSKNERLIGEELIKEIRERLYFLTDVGLHYLTLERTAPTLSGGEAQRVRLASQIGSGLSQATYVLDEPSIGLHPRDNTKLLASLRALCDKGNTVIVVEHDEETIVAADHIVDVGPLAGKDGGRVLVSGSMKDLLASKESITGAYLRGDLSIPIPKKRRSKGKEAIVIEGASHHNLKNVKATFPLGMLIAVTGVSGSGKSSLVSDILHPTLSAALHGGKEKPGKHKSITGVDLIDKVIAIDQSPIGRTPRSNPSTYVKLFDLIRDLFAKLPEAQAQGYTAGHFSFNVKEGSCPHCSGMGMTRIDMDFMEDEWVSCEHCQGRRFDEKTLSVLYRGKSIYDVLEMRIEEAASFFEAIPPIRKKIETLLDVGLGYLTLGQSSPTLSGGEAQRIKLAKELSRPSTGKTLYILDEPTTGLHFHDIARLVQILQKLVDKGNTVLVIEHNMDLVKTADWIIDLGPEGGAGGGKIVTADRPEKVAQQETPTGKAVAAALYPTPIVAAKTKKKDPSSAQGVIQVIRAEQNNLKGVDAAIPHGKITVCTGPSGSGKSSLAFETVYAEGQRRYTESMSPYARQFVKQMGKPKVEAIDGLLASIAIEQKAHAGNPRSTIGTMTEVYDYLRIVFAHLGTPFSPETGEEIRAISKGFVCDKLLLLPEKTKVQILAPLNTKEDFGTLKQQLLKEGFLRIRLNGHLFELDGEIPFERGRKNELYLIVDRLTIQEKGRKRLYDAIDIAAKVGKNSLVVDIEGKDELFNLSFADPTTGKSYPPITPHTFSFNTEQGMCFDCLGLGFQYGAHLQKHREVMRLSPYDLIRKLWKEGGSFDAFELFVTLCETLGIDPDSPLDELPPKDLQILLSGMEEPIQLKGESRRIRFRGIGPTFAHLARIALEPLKSELSPWVDQITCPSCQGSRLSPLARNVRLRGLSIADVCQMPIGEAKQFVESTIIEKESEEFLRETLTQLKRKLHFLCSIGLDYLSLDRGAPTLSGGETQRIRLSRQLGSYLTGCLYVLDEPTIGLHPHNNALLNKSLRELCEGGNTLLLVEHDPMTIEIADLVLDFGPAAGKHGGQIIARGTVEEIKNNPDSLTGAYLSGRLSIPYPSKRRKGKGVIRIEHGRLHNLKDITVEIPKGVITCLSGVSGSGKSTLINDLLRPAVAQSLATRARPDSIELYGSTISGLASFERLLVMDQNPIGHTNRADISTYVDLSTPLRKHFAELPEAKIRGLLPKHFSFNHLKGMCTNCFGLGKKRIEMQFLPPVQVVCEACHGYRLNPLSLEVKTHGKHMGQILKMTVEESMSEIPPIPKVLKILETLLSVGLGYLELGQEIATLSGGEAQRLRLARELAKRGSGKTLYLLDEPTIGLHPEDISLLIPIFEALADKGHTVVIIEHNLDVLKNGDYLIDLGPGAGVHGGKVIGMGTPEEIASNSQSLTGQYLSPSLI